MSLRPTSVIIKYFKDITMLDADKGFSLVSSQIISYFIRKNTLDESSKILMLQNFLNELSHYSNNIITELVTNTVNQFYPQYVRNKNLLKLYNSINNQLKNSFNDTILYSTYDLAQKYGLVATSGSNFKIKVTAGTNNTWIKNEQYNANGSDLKPDYILINSQNSSTNATPPENITIPDSSNTFQKGIYYMINSDPSQILFFSIEPIKHWSSYKKNVK
jgi:hypothetical protein